MPRPFYSDAHHHDSLPQQLGLVWNPLLKADPDGPALIFYAALRYGVQFISNPFPCLCSTPFFFVSTEMVGCPAAWNASTCALMYSNWALRSGWLVPSRVFWFACRLKPRRRSNRPTSFWLAVKPRSASARARWRWLLLTHSNAASGSPRIADCTSLASASSSPGSVSVFGLRPPPARRMRSGVGFSPFRNSASPRPIVLRARPVTAETAVTPPRPNASASLAATSRRSRSFRNGASASKRALMLAVSITQPG